MKNSRRGSDARLAAGNPVRDGSGGAHAAPRLLETSFGEKIASSCSMRARPHKPAVTSTDTQLTLASFRVGGSCLPFLHAELRRGQKRAKETPITHLCSWT